MVGGLIGALEKATGHILDLRAAVGANIRRMDATSNRLDDLSLSVTRLLAEVEDADIIKVTTELATQQNVYQSALNAVARVLQPSLVDFVQ
jgi:flagellar hook-associated protein 3 FlgL